MPSSAMHIIFLTLISSLALAVPNGNNDCAKFCQKHYSSCGFKNVGQCASNAAKNGYSCSCCPPGQQVDKHDGLCKTSSTRSSTLSSTHSSTLSYTGSSKLSSTGSSTLSSTGSSKLSSTGSSQPSSTGSSKLSSTGSSKSSYSTTGSTSKQTQSASTRTTYTSPTMTATVTSSGAGCSTPTGSSGSGNGGNGNSGGSGNGGNNNLPQLIFPATCSSGSPYCCNGDSCENLQNSNVSCTSGSVTCCNSNAGLISVNVAICGNSFNVPITISALNGLTL